MTRIVFITEVLERSEESMLIRTILIGSEDGGAISRHEELKRMPHFGDWEALSKELHDRLTEVVLEETDSPTKSQMS
jgi:hypothetical protein